jgi:hypothetical protein
MAGASARPSAPAPPGRGRAGMSGHGRALRVVSDSYCRRAGRLARLAAAESVAYTGCAHALAGDANAPYGPEPHRAQMLTLQRAGDGTRTRNIDLE